MHVCFQLTTFFRKILKKLQSHDEKMEKDKKKKSKKKIFGRADNRDSGVDDNCSISEEQGENTITSTFL